MIIGVTGGIGSGKSTILHQVMLRGYPVYYCDAEAKRIIAEDQSVRRQMIALFGERVYEQGVYQTQHVATQVFANNDKLNKLNAIVHPAVSQDIRNWAKGKRLAFIESAILVSSGMDAMCEATVLVTAPEQVRVQRVIHRAAQQGQTIQEEQVRARIRAQEKDFEVLANFDYQIINDGITPIANLVEQLISFAEQL